MDFDTNDGLAIVTKVWIPEGQTFTCRECQANIAFDISHALNMSTTMIVVELKQGGSKCRYHPVCYLGAGEPYGEPKDKTEEVTTDSLHRSGHASGAAMKTAKVGNATVHTAGVKHARRPRF